MRTSTLTNWYYPSTAAAMSLSSILQKIQSRGQIKSHPSQNAEPAAPAAPAQTPTSSSGRAVDPVVARLKAARKAEREAKEKEARAKKGLPPKKEPARRAKPVKTSGVVGRGPTKNLSKGQTAINHTTINQTTNVRPAEKKLKMSFSELMKKASSIDQSKMSIDLKAKTKTPEPRRKTPERRTPEAREGREARLDRPDKLQGPQRPQRPRERPSDTPREGKNIPRQKLVPKPRDHVARPLPMRQPSAKLQSKLQQRTAKGRDVENEGDDSDMGSFIASDEEEQVSYGQDYDRDEIWSIFNRGRKRSHYEQYDSDSDNMEATGAEILEEEAFSKRLAVEDDRRELEEEQRRAALKLARQRRS